MMKPRRGPRRGWHRAAQFFVFTLAVAGLSGIVAADVLAAEVDDEELELIVELDPVETGYFAGYTAVPQAVDEPRAEPPPMPEAVAVPVAKPVPKAKVKRKKRRRSKKGLGFGRMDAY